MYRRFWRGRRRLARARDHLGKLRANRIGEADVGHQTIAEERGNAAAGAVEKLVRDDEILRPVLLFEAGGGNCAPLSVVVAPAGSR